MDSRKGRRNDVIADLEIMAKLIALSFGIAIGEMIQIVRRETGEGKLWNCSTIIKDLVYLIIIQWCSKLNATRSS